MAKKKTTKKPKPAEAPTPKAAPARVTKPQSAPVTKDGKVRVAFADNPGGRYAGHKAGEPFWVPLAEYTRLQNSGAPIGPA